MQKNFILTQLSPTSSPHKASVLTRTKQPRPEKKALLSKAILSLQPTPSSTPKIESSNKKLDPDDVFRIDTQLLLKFPTAEANEDLMRVISSCKRIELDYDLIEEDGSAGAPPNGDYNDIRHLLAGAFPTLEYIKMSSPFIILLCRELPPAPWPFTIGGTPMHFTLSGLDYGIDIREGGRGAKVPLSVDLRDDVRMTRAILDSALEVFKSLDITVYEIFAFDCFWNILIPDGTPLTSVPMRIGNKACRYRFKSEESDRTPSVLGQRVPNDAEADDTNYATAADSLLRPGIILTSSVISTGIDGVAVDCYKTTTSGILVVNERNEHFVTVATNMFQADGLVYHPNPISGSVIGRVVSEIPGTGISLVKLNAGLRYVNHTFGSKTRPSGIKMNGINAGYFPHLKHFNEVTMDSPFTGFAEGQVAGIGLKLAGGDYIKHEWLIFDYDGISEPVNGSCGTPILDSDGALVGIFRFRDTRERHCLCVSGTELQRFHYEVCSDEVTF